MIVSIQTNLKNELDIIEWIFYHLFIMKFDHIYLYDNESEFKIENYFEIYPILTKYVTIIYVNSENINFTIKEYCRKHYQINYLKQSDYTLFLDGDEYLCLKSHDNIKELLNDDKYKKFNTILFNWKIFGCLNKICKPNNYILENYINYNDNYTIGSLNSHFKVLVKNNNIIDCSTNPHIFIINKMVLCDSSGKSVNLDITKPYYINREQINYIHHYQWKSLEDWIIKCNSCIKVLDNGADKKKFRSYSKWNIDNIYNKQITFNCTDNYMIKYKYILDYYYNIYNKSNYLQKSKENELDNKLNQENEIIPKENEIIPKENEIIPKENEIIPKENEIIPKENKKYNKIKLLLEQLSNKSINDVQTKSINDVQTKSINDVQTKSINDVQNYESNYSNYDNIIDKLINQIQSNTYNSSFSTQSNNYVKDISKMTNQEIIREIINYDVYDEKIYKKFNNDLSQLDNNELYNHFINNAKKEKRIYCISPLFNCILNYYKEFNDDLKHLNEIEIYKHFINNGIYENRLFNYPKEFDKEVNKYSKLYPEFKNNKYKLYEFYIRYLYLLPNDFNVNNYKLINPTLNKYLKTDSEFIKHYIIHGKKENIKYKL
jgi:hypothetical protein